jgi:hypothetical protein
MGSSTSLSGVMPSRPSQLDKQQPLTETAIAAEIMKGLNDLADKYHWQLPGFKLTSKPFRVYKGLIHPVVRSVQGDPLRFSAFLALELDEKQQHGFNALRSVVALFQSMLSNKTQYLESTTDFYGSVGKNLGCKARDCERIAKSYIIGRQAYLKDTNQSPHICSIVTDLVDEWISFTDIATSPRIKLKSNANGPAHLLSPPASAQSSPIRTAVQPISRKRKGTELEQAQAKRAHSFFGQDNDNRKNCENVKPTAETGHEHNYDGQKKPSALSDTAAAAGTTSGSRTTQRGVVRPSVVSSVRVSTLATPKHETVNSVSVNKALQEGCEAPNKLQHQSSDQYHRLRKRITAQVEEAVERLDTLEQQTAEQKASTEKTQTNQADILDKLLTNLADIRASVGSTSARLEERLMEYLENTLENHGREVSSGFLIELEQHKRSVEQLLKTQHQATLRPKVHLTQSDQSVERILDRFLVNHNKDMEKMRRLIADQEATITEQGKLMEEMRKESSEMAMKLELLCSQHQNSSVNGADADVANGLLWTPKRG